MKNKRGTRALILNINNKILPKSKRSQVTIFIIIAVLIVAFGLLIYFLGPKIGISTSPQAKNPREFIETCVIDDLKDNVEKISLQGGSFNPEGYFTYNNLHVDYLCYTNEYYNECIIQQPLLQQNIEKEVKESIQDTVDSCFNSLKQNYEDDGYSVNLRTGAISVELLPKIVVTTLDYDISLSKEETEEYKEFSIVLNNNLYELISIANSIVDWEATYGDADVTIYMGYYPDLKVEKNIKDDGTKIYILTNRNVGNKFQFASRSFVSRN